MAQTKNQPQATTKKTTGRGRKKGSGKVAGSGRKKGTPNKVTTEFRQFFSDLLQGEIQRGNIQLALATLSVENQDKYLYHIEKIAPFVMPQLQSVEFNGQTEVSNPFMEHMTKMAGLASQIDDQNKNK